MTLGQQSHGASVWRTVTILATAALLACAPADGAERWGAMIVTPEEYGAAGNGRSDDLASLRKAIDALKASGGGTLAGRPGAIYRIDDRLTLDGIANVRLAGNGATLYRRTGGSAAGAVALIGATDVQIDGWSFASDYDGFRRGSTGSNPNILLDVAKGRANQSITISDNRFRNGNHANITIGTTGIDAILPPFGVANRQIRIQRNRLGDAGVGVFVYKGTRDFEIAANTGSRFSIAAIVLDTHAASDPDRSAQSIRDGRIDDNRFDSIIAARLPAEVGRKLAASQPAFAARGIVIKGDVRDVMLRGNVIVGVESITDVDTFGLLIAADQARVPKSPARIAIESNVFDGVKSSGLGATAAWAFSLGADATDIVVRDNVFRNAERGVLLSGGSSFTFAGNQLDGVATAVGFPLQMLAGSRPPTDKRIERNIIHRGSSPARRAMDVPEGGALVTGNRHFGFPGSRY